MAFQLNMTKIFSFFKENFYKRNVLLKNDEAKSQPLHKQCKKKDSSSGIKNQDPVSHNARPGQQFFQTSSSDFKFCDFVRLKIHR